jgi:type II secretory pathway pseudopilin PulG
LIELLVVIAIAAVLSSLILPAIQAARESARVSHCRSNVSQLSKAMLQHEEKFGFFPTGGWSPLWLGVAERTADSSQPGGWTFGVLPHIEELATRDSVANATAATAAAAYQQLVAIPVRAFACPSRRTAKPLPVTGVGPFRTAAATQIPLTSAVRSDYAANGGSIAGCPPMKLLSKISGAVSNSAKIKVSHVPPETPTAATSLTCLTRRSSTATAITHTTGSAPAMGARPPSTTRSFRHRTCLKETPGGEPRSPSGSNCLTTASPISRMALPTG